MRILFCVALLLSGVGQVYAEGVVYNIDFNAPTNSAGRLVATGVGSGLVSAINAGSPQVVSSFGGLTNQPLEFDLQGNAGYWFYDQIQLNFDSPRLDDNPLFNVSFDFCSGTIIGSGAAFILLIDDPSGIHKLNFLNDGTIQWEILATSYKKTIGHFAPGDTFNLTLQLDLQNQRCLILRNGTLLDSVGFAAAYIKDLRLSYGLLNGINASTTTDMSAVAIDNLVVWTEKFAPTLSWDTPADLKQGYPLTTAQLNAKANLPGSFEYSPPLGTLLPPGPQKLTATFTPTDTYSYGSTSIETVINIVAGNTRLANIAARGYCSTGSRVMIGGFVVGGATAKRVLVRAIGPSLATRGLNAADVLADPVIEVHKGDPIIATNDNWSDNLNATEMNSVAAQIGAGALDPGDTRSSAILLNLQPGPYTFVARGKNDTSGIVLLEVFDADPTSSAKLVNIATRAYSKPGDGVTIGGFVIAGDTRKRILLRGVGPTLTKLGISVADAMVDPTLELHDASHGNATIGTNDIWSNNANFSDLLAVSTRIGASPIDAGDSGSSALLVSLDPGAYTFIAAGKANTAGIILVEIYDAD